MCVCVRRLHYHDSSPFRPGCENSTLLWCDFSALDVPSEFGEYVGRVRAVRGHQVSPWARSQLLTLDKHSESLLEVLLLSTTSWPTQTFLVVVSLLRSLSVELQLG